MSIDQINKAQPGVQASSFISKAPSDIEKQAKASEVNESLENRINSTKDVKDILKQRENGEVESEKEENIEDAVKSVNEKINVDQLVQRELQFNIDEDSQRTIITVLDKKTEEVIRQIPTEQLLELEKELSRNGSTKGLLMKVVA